MDMTEYDHIDVWRSACVGGGSVVFTGAMLQPPRNYFDAIFEGRVNYDEMHALYYPRVRQMLRLSPMPADIYNSAPFGHSRRWDASARRAGYAPRPVDGIWNWDVVRAELRRAPPQPGQQQRSEVRPEPELPAAGQGDGQVADLPRP
ncbi:hypothetical protein [Paracidovorax wautersii]|uniref:hypothetical protein n=1 Tax=Paracidovorax wautersii TaxID=1177982 RepID=UPI0031E48EBC